ncbi:Putative motility protein [Clostridium sp. DSM 8431]|uniref:YjfB family protein n=1 Tax=Clostridium sp. DSM 8431 TaxID=1761781 RepID=UPI0008EF2D0A|nr:YjfB family protein [Clostridium sp. DSM 8431]SFU32638.1 Putative motility protein [Clostridium sp. DSM 8431]
MEIGGLSVTLNQSALQTKVGAALLKMSMDNTKEIADNLNNMMEAIDPNLGKVIDARA